ncbi:MAG: ATP-binding protein [Burkholderiales bacterium]
MKENQNIEWKSSWRDEYLKWICGFANAEGGTLVIGKNDKGKVVGVPDAAKLLEDIPNKARDILGVMVDVNLRGRPGHESLEITVPAYPNPISYKGEYCYRSGSTNQTLKGVALDRFLMRKQGRHWDGAPVPRVSTRDLNGKVFSYFRQQARNSLRLSTEILREPNASLIEKLHLKEGDYLKRAAVLLFHADPERFFTGAYVKIGFFENNVDLRHHDEVHGDLFSQVEQTIDVLKAKYLKAWISYEGLQRIETLPVPETALREAVLNAVVHKDYGSGTPIQISVYPDKLMIWNPGQLPHDWTVKNLLEKHASEPFNPDVANAFFRAGKIEAWGRGIERIMAECELAGMPATDVRYEPTGLWTVFHFADRKNAQENPQETTQENPQEKILALLRTEPFMTRKELAGRMAVSMDSIKHHLDTLKSSRLIRHIGPTKAGHWEVLTDKRSGEVRKPSVQTPVETRVETPVETRVKTPVKILQQLKANPKMTLAELADAIGLSLSAVERASSNLVKSGQLRYVGPKRTGHWEIVIGDDA